MRAALAEGFGKRCDSRGGCRLRLRVISDHYHPWLEAQGHSPYAWSVFGATAHATERIGLIAYVRTPTIRYHPALIALKAATVALLADGRFRLGLGAGEMLNEHVVGQGYPMVDIRYDMLHEAVEVIGKLWSGEYVTHHGRHYDVESAKIFDLPYEPLEIGIAVSGISSCALAGEMADIMIGTQPKAELVQMFSEHGGSGKPAVGQTPVCWGPDEAACRKLAHEQFSWAVGGWKLQAELPNPANFEAFAQTVTEDQVAQMIPCGSDTGKIVQTVKTFLNAGYAEVALVQIGPEQEAFCDFFRTRAGFGAAQDLARSRDPCCLPGLCRAAAAEEKAARSLSAP